jgi:hypothetical protein
MGICEFTRLEKHTVTLTAKAGFFMFIYDELCNSKVSFTMLTVLLIFLELWLPIM